MACQYLFSRSRSEVVMLRRPLSVPVARIGRSVPESRCAAPSCARLVLPWLAVAALGAQALSGWAAGPAPAPRIPVACNGTASCGNSGAALKFIQGSSAILPGYKGQTQAAVIGGTASAMTINQYADSVVLNWGSFNVGSGNSVTFKQPSVNSAALNRIYQGSPSEISGAINANGQIYLINQNGILFHNGTQLNVGGLVASSLQIKDSDFLSSILTPWQNGLPLLTRSSHVDAQGNVVPDDAGDIQVDAGAQLDTLPGASGRILLAAPNVQNAGLIRTPGGQTILAAGDKIYVNASDPGDQSLRGLVVAIDNGGLVKNLGQILAQQGNITLAGATVNQSGKVSATTSVSLNGSIYLKAGDGAFNAGNLTSAPARGGDLTLAAGSTTEVRPELTDATTAVDAQLQPKSVIALQGLNVHLAGKAGGAAGALVAAPGGSVTVSARSNLNDGAALTTVNQDSPADPTVKPKAIGGSGTIVMEDGATIDVSGTQDVQLSVARNFVQAELRGNELQDSPTQRNGFLYTKTVTVDARTVDGNGNLPIANIKGYVSGIGRTVAERTAGGGSITLEADSAVVIRQHATLNLSGGWLSYQDANVQATQLLDAFGKRYEIATAPKDRNYIGFANGFTRSSGKWGSSTTWNAPAPLVKGYIEGRNAGSLGIYATQTVLDGDVLAATRRGPNQRSLANAIDPKDAANWALVNGVPSAPANIDAQYFQQAPLGGALTLGNRDVLRTWDLSLEHQAAALDPAVTYDTLVTSGVRSAASLTTHLGLDSLLANGVSRLSLAALDHIDIAPGAFNLGPGGQLTLNANQISDQASFSATGGAIVLRAQQPATTNVQAGLITAPSRLVLADATRLDVSGAWVNDSSVQASADLGALRATAGGSVSLRSDGDLDPGVGSSIDVSGGAYLSRGNALTAGSAGSITLGTSGVFGTTGRLDQLGLQGAGFAKGGKLSVTALTLRIENTRTATGVVAPVGELQVDQSQFAQGGFASYALTGVAGLTVEADTAVNAVAGSRSIGLTDRLLVSGTPVAQVGQIGVPDAAVRNNPVQIALSAGSGGAQDAQLTVATGASIATDPGGSIALRSQGSLYVDGTLRAPSGTLSLTVDSGDTNLDFRNTQSLWLGKHAVLDAHEAVQVVTAANGLRSGGLINDGGNSVTLNAVRGILVAEPTARIEVSGSSATVDLATTPGGARLPVVLAGSAGSVSLASSDAIAFDGQIDAHAGGSGGQGGTLSVNLDQSPGYGALTQSQPPYATTDTVILSASSGGQQSLGRRPGDAVASTDALYGTALLNTDRLAASGIDALALTARDRIQFRDQASLALGRSLTLDAPLLSSAPDTRASLQAPLITVRNISGRTASAPAIDTSDASTLALTAGQRTVNAQGKAVDTPGQLDVSGTVTIGGFARTTLASFGDVRLVGGLARNNVYVGSLESAGSLILDAAQIYPGTLSSFTVKVDAATTPTVNGSSPELDIQRTTTSASPVPLSAGGTLTLRAPIIRQDGTLRAPFGTIDLQASQTTVDVASNTYTAGTGVLTLGAGSVTSSSGPGKTVPFGNTSNGGGWYYPFDTTIARVNGAPAKSVRLRSDRSLIVAQGASIDLSGGGDLLAYESVIGPGGSQDILSGPNTYAILPDSPYAGSYAATDPAFAATEAKAAKDRSDAGLAPGQALKVGDAITLALPQSGSGAPFASGTYTLLPAHYALLPGAYAIRFVASNDATPGTANRQADGSFLVSGKRSVLNAGISQPRWSTWQLLPSAAVHAASQLDTYTVNNYFPTLAATTGVSLPVLAADAGRLAIQAGAQLDLQTTDFNFGGDSYLQRNSQGGLVYRDKDGVITATPNGNPLSSKGRGGEFDLAAQYLAVVSQVNPNDASLVDATSNTPYLQIAAATLNALKADRVVIGGGVDAATGVLTTVSKDVTVKLQNGQGPAQTLAAPDLILAAREYLLVDSGSTIGATASPSGVVAGDISTSGDGALLRLTDGALPAFTRTPGATHGADLTLRAGVTLDTRQGTAAAGSVTLDSAGTVTVDQATLLATAALRVDAASVNLGANAAAQAAPGGVTLGNSTLAQAQELYLQTPGAIRLYGATTVGTTTPLSRLTLDAGALEVIGAGSQNLQAGTVVLRATVASTAEAVSGSGQLDIHAVTLADGSGGQIDLGAGTQAIVGTTATTLTADRALTTHGSGALSSAGRLTVRAPLVAAAAGSSYLISTPAALILQGGAANAPASTAGAGGRLALNGQSVAIDTAVRAQAGRISARASGDLSLGSHALVDTSAVQKTFRGATQSADAGVVQLTSATGSITVQPGAIVDVSASGAANAGNLSFSAPQGAVTLQGSLRGSASADRAAGSLSIDERQLTDTRQTADAAAARALRVAALDALDQAQTAGGFAEAYTVRVREGDLDIAAGTAIAAHHLTLEADQGSVAVAGRLAADGDSRHSDAGSIALWAGQDLSLGNGAQLSASSSQGDAGRITLGLASASTGTLSIDHAQLALDAAANAKGGTVYLRVPTATDANGTPTAIRVGSINAQISAAQVAPVVQVEAVKRYDSTAINSADAVAIDAADATFFAGKVANDVAALQGQSTAIAAGLHFSSGGSDLAPHLLSGVELTQATPGSLATLAGAGALDFSGLRTGADAGVLTVRAAGDLNVANGLHDGFTSAGRALAGDSWGYRLVAGADVAAADPFATVASSGAGRLSLASTARIYTGTGNIDLAAAGNVVFGNDGAGSSASVFTAGQASNFTSKGIAAPFAAGAYFKAPSGLVRQYTWHGGDVAIRAGGDVLGSDSNQVVNDWLYRSASFQGKNFASLTGGRIGIYDQTTWWVAFDQFHMDAGALGGGNVTVAAGGNVQDFSAAIPTQGRLGGGTIASPGFFSANLLVENGGNLNVRSGGDIIGGSYYVEKGAGLLRAGGGITASSQTLTPFSTVLALGDAQVTLEAGDNIDLLTAYNPFLAPQSYLNAEKPLPSASDPNTVLPDRILDGHVLYFSTYAQDSAVNLLSSGGDVSLGRGLGFAASHAVDPVNPGATPPVLISSLRFLDTDPGPGLRVLPGNVALTSMSGNVAVPESFTLSPAPRGNLRVLAGNSVDLRPDTSGGVALNLADFGPETLPDPAHPLLVRGGSGATVVQETYAISTVHAIAPLHAGDTSPVLVAADQGSVEGLSGGRNGTFISAGKPVVVEAGQDIIGLTVQAQHLANGDVSRFDAGRDIVFVPPSTTAAVDDQTSVEIDGPGMLQLRAGRNLDLGTGLGVRTFLNQYQLASDAGASVSLYAGLGSCAGGACTPAYQTFAAAYIDPALAVSRESGNNLLLVNYVNRLTGSTYAATDANALAQAWTDFQKLDVNQQAGLVEQVLSNQIHVTTERHGIHLATGTGDLQAMGTLFQGTVIDALTGKAVDASNPPALFDPATLSPQQSDALKARIASARAAGVYGQGIAKNIALTPSAQLATVLAYPDSPLAQAILKANRAVQGFLDSHTKALPFLADPNSADAKKLLADPQLGAIAADIVKNQPELTASGFGPTVTQRNAFLQRLGVPANAFDKPAIYAPILAKLGLSAGPGSSLEDPAVYLPLLTRFGLADATLDAQVKAFSNGPTLASAFVQPAQPRGDINLVYSQVRTTAKGDIALYAPSGGINVGLANSPPGAVAKQAGALGVVTQASGNISALAMNDINVNASRVFTVGGGDLSLFSALGNIDAGKGAKTTVLVPPPKVVIDPATGTVTIVQSGATNGAGIATLKTSADQLAGYVDLIAPFGKVDAGDAGIRSTSTVFIEGQVVNAANISAGGPTAGVPSSAPPPPVAAPTSSTTKDASSSSADTTKRLAEAAQESNKLQNAFKPTIVTVDVVSSDDVEAAKEKEPRKSAPKR
jgi:filamentous hemagglutinin family protein